MCDDEELSGEEIAAIKESEGDIRAGGVWNLHEIMKDPGNDEAIRISPDQ